jgi:hypothetical protein
MEKIFLTSLNRKTWNIYSDYVNQIKEGMIPNGRTATDHTKHTANIHRKAVPLIEHHPKETEEGMCSIE